MVDHKHPGWRDSSLVNSTGCSSKDPGSSLSTHKAAYNCLCSTGSDGLFWPLRAAGMHAGKNTWTRKVLNFFFPKCHSGMWLESLTAFLARHCHPPDFATAHLSELFPQHLTQPGWEAGASTAHPQVLVWGRLGPPQPTGPGLGLLFAGFTLFEFQSQAGFLPYSCGQCSITELFKAPGDSHLCEYLQHRACGGVCGLTFPRKGHFGYFPSFAATKKAVIK